MKFNFLCLLSLFYFINAATRYENIVFEGGGSKAISYIGALKALKKFNYYNDNRYTFTNIAGSSAGCFTGFLVTLDINPTHLEFLIYNLDILPSMVTFNAKILENIFKDPSIDDHQKQLQHYNSIFGTIKQSVKTIFSLNNLYVTWINGKSPGLSTHETFLDFIKSFIYPLSPYRDQLHEHITFNDLQKITNHSLTCFAVRLNDNSLISYNQQITPNYCVLKALYASMTIPGLFKPIIDEATQYPLIDGGIYMNFPIYTYDNIDGSIDGISKNTLGLSLHEKHYEQCNIINELTLNYHYTNISSIDYAILLYHAILNRENIYYSMDKRNKDRIIYLNSPIKTLHCYVNIKNKQYAIDNAYEKTIDFLKKTPLNI